MPPLIARWIYIPTFAWNYLWGRIFKARHWWDTIEPNVMLGARPLRADVARLDHLGVRGVINMCQEYRGPIDLYQQHGIEQLWLPTIDFQPPSLTHVIQGVEFLQAKVSRQETVYVHCKAGRGRSATIVLCWLIQYRGMTAQQAQAKLLECRPHTNRHLDERRVVLEFIEQLSDGTVTPEIGRQESQ